MSRGLVVDPRGSVDRPTAAGPPPAITDLAGLRVGIRHDGTWRSWEWVYGDWVARLAGLGATTHLWQSGGHDEATATAQRAFYEGSDVVLAGLCNCGSCTLHTVRDAVGALDRAIPTVVVSTGHFEAHARRFATELGWDDLPMVVLPAGLEGRPRDEVLAVADERFPDVLAALARTR